MNLPLDDLAALAQRLWGSFLGRCLRRFIRMQGIDRCLVLSSQAFTALIPLLILVSTLAPPGEPDVVARTIITKFGLSGESEASVEQLFRIPSGATGAVSLASAILLLYSGVSFTRRMQKMYRAAWNRQNAGVSGNLFAVLGLVVLLAEVLVLYAIMSIVRDLPGHWVLVFPLSLLTGLVPWTSVPYLLMNRQVHWRRLLPAGVLTATAMALFGTATTLYMPDLIERYTRDFGLFGVTIAIIGWLLGASGIVVAGTTIGAEFDHSLAPWALRVKERLRLTDPKLPPREPSLDEAPGLTSKDLVLLVRVAATWLVMAAAVWVATIVLPGIHVDGGVLTYLWVSLLLGLVNALLGPVLRMVVPDVSWPRLGLVALAVNGALLGVTALLSVNLDVGGPADAVLGALVISVAISLCEFVVRPFTRSG